jgi:hypothetical protein
MSQAVAREGEVGLEGLAFKFDEHVGTLGELCDDARVGSEVI